MDDKMNDVIVEVQNRLGEEFEVKKVEVMKNNDTKLKGIQVRKKNINVAKICYWTGESVDEIVAVINRRLAWNIHLGVKKNFKGNRMIVNGSSNLVEFYVKMGKMNCNL